MDAYSAPGESKEPYDTTNRTRAELIKNGVYPEEVRDHAQQILEDVEPGVERYRYAAALTRFVHENVECTDSEGGNKALYRPDYVLDHGVETDCEDQAVLLASLLTVRSFDTRFVGAINEGWGNHLMMQVRFDLDSLPELRSEAESFHTGDVPELKFQTGEDGGAWLLCDPVFSPVPGYVNTEFFTDAGDGKLVFKEETQHDYICHEYV